MLLALSLALVLAPSSHAAANAALLGTAQHIVQSAQSDVVYLAQNVDRCTSYGSAIKSHLIQPIGADLANFAKRLARYSDEAPASCTSRADLDYISGVISAKLALATQPQMEMMNMSGDEAMTRALLADDNHPDCRADDPSDPRTTPELKTYFGLKLKLIALKASVAALKSQTECAKRE
jgi:hypothetical protein